jgi:hypothetical protein
MESCQVIRSDKPTKGKEMKKNMLLCLAGIFLISACSSTSTPAPEDTPPAAPTPSIGYQVVGNTMNTFMVVVDPKRSTDREGLLELSKYLCTEHPNCRIWYWDDINKADTSYPIDPSYEQSLIAVFTFDEWNNKQDLVVYTLGDK